MMYPETETLLFLSDQERHDWLNHRESKDLFWIASNVITDVRTERHKEYWDNVVTLASFLIEELRSSSTASDIYCAAEQVRLAVAIAKVAGHAKEHLAGPGGFAGAIDRCLEAFPDIGDTRAKVTLLRDKVTKAKSVHAWSDDDLDLIRYLRQFKDALGLMKVLRPYLDDDDVREGFDEWLEFRSSIP